MNFMLQKLTLCFALVCLLSAADAQQLRTPVPSPTQTVKQDVGIGSIELSYSRPGVKNRKVFGDLVPFGNVWRTGANNATTLTFSEEVIIGGTKLPAGKYGLLSIPEKNEWTLILTKQTNVTSPAAYKESEDVVRIKAKAKELDDKVETFTMQFANVTSNSTDLQIMWDKTMVTLPISSDVDARVMAQINNAMFKDNRPYYNAGMYYLETGRDLNQALAWFDEAIKQTPTGYWIYHQKANTLAKLGRKQEARDAANKSIELAKVAKNDDYVKLNEKLLSDLK
jgi:tetratricopeptide (TPR) repeat protein